MDRLVYFGVLGALVIAAVLRSGQLRWGNVARNAGAWLLIFVAAVVAAGLWADIRHGSARQAVLSESGEIALPRAPDGHYYATLDVNGTPIRFVVDTGATGIVLSRADAARAGIDVGALGYFGRAMTANGPVRTAPVRLDTLSLGPVTDRDVAAFVNEGAMDGSLLGMTYLQRYDRVEIADGRMILTR